MLLCSTRLCDLVSDICQLHISVIPSSHRCAAANVLQPSYDRFEEDFEQCVTEHRWMSPRCVPTPALASSAFEKPSRTNELQPRIETNQKPDRCVRNQAEDQQGEKSKIERRAKWQRLQKVESGGKWCSCALPPNGGASRDLFAHHPAISSSSSSFGSSISAPFCLLSIGFSCIIVSYGLFSTSTYQHRWTLLIYCTGKIDSQSPPLTG